MLQSIFPNLVSVTGDHHQPMITGDHAEFHKITERFLLKKFGETNKKTHAIFILELNQ